jgi:TonB family protein
LATAPQLDAKSKDLAQVAVSTPDALRKPQLEDASSATPRLTAKSAPQSLEGATHSLESRRTEFDLAGGDIDPAPRSSTGSAEGLAETGVAGPGKATLRPSKGGTGYRAPSAGLAPAHRQGEAIADVGADDIVGNGEGGGTADKGGRRTILDYGSGSGGGLRGRASGDIAPDRSAIEPTQKAKEDAQKQLADTKATELTANGMNMSITGEISGRKVLHMVPPKYSSLAKKKGWEGVVAVHFTVLPDGRVKDNLYFEQTSAHRDLNQAAMTAIRQFKFAPLSGDDSQVEQWGLITFVFRLH